jgi:hypothetical protein
MRAGPADDCGSATNQPTTNWALDVGSPYMVSPACARGNLNSCASFPQIFWMCLRRSAALIALAGGYRVPDSRPWVI